MSRRKKLTNNSGIPQHEIENIARILLPDILAFYESEEGQREFAEWKAARDGAKKGKNSSPKLFSGLWAAVSHKFLKRSAAPCYRGLSI